jgi:competence protein ComEA
MKPLIALFALGWSAIAAGAPALVELNQASEIDLDGIKGIGPAMSRQMLQGRQLGPYAHWPDLMHRVKGLGTHKAQALSEAGLRVNGLAYPGKPASASAAR